MKAQTLLLAAAVVMTTACTGGGEPDPMQGTVDASAGTIDQVSTYRAIAQNVSQAELKDWRRADCFEAVREGSGAIESELFKVCFDGGTVELEHRVDSEDVGRLVARWSQAGFTLRLDVRSASGTMRDYFPDATLIINDAGTLDTFQLLDPVRLTPLRFHRATL